MQGTVGSPAIPHKVHGVPHAPEAHPPDEFHGWPTFSQTVREKPANAVFVTSTVLAGVPAAIFYIKGITTDTLDAMSPNGFQW